MLTHHAQNTRRGGARDIGGGDEIGSTENRAGENPVQRADGTYNLSRITRQFIDDS